MASPMPQPSTKPSKPRLIYILGGPGVGKGSLSVPLANQFTNVYHLSVGDHLRDLLTQDNSQSTSQSLGGLEYEAFSTLMQQRQLLPTETIVSIVDAALKSIYDTASASKVSKPIILVDGFPRSRESAVLADARWGAPHLALLFHCPREQAEARFLTCGRSADDSAEVFRKRYDEFERLNGEVVDMYRDTLIRVDTETLPWESWDRLHDKVGQLMKDLGGTESKVSHET